MYLGTIQENKNGNGKLTLTADNLKFACAELGISDDKHTLRRAARGFDLYYSGKVEHVNDHTFKVASQYDRQRPYQVILHEGATKPYGYCTCPDWMNYSGDTDVPNVDFWCKHMISAAIWLHKNGNGSKPTNECGSERAKRLQDKMNGQLNKSGNNGNGAGNNAPSQPTQPNGRCFGIHLPTKLDVTDPFQRSEQNDIDQIEGRGNGELAWEIDGKYVISYRGIMKLAEKHDITFETAIHDETHTAIAKAHRNGSERGSGKPINGNEVTAMELAKRNAARQLLPLAEIKAMEKKAKLETEFSWEKAKAKCVELVTDFNLDIIIHELIKENTLRSDCLSGYNRTEWLLIFEACRQDAAQSNDDNNEGEDNSSPSPTVENLDPKSVNNWSYNSPEFLAKCREAIQKVRDDKVEANEMPLQKECSRKLQMDKKLRTWLIEADGTKQEISCREICEKFESNIVTRLRAGIDSGADISTVELDD